MHHEPLGHMATFVAQPHERLANRLSMVAGGVPPRHAGHVGVANNPPVGNHPDDAVDLPIRLLPDPVARWRHKRVAELLADNGPYYFFKLRHGEFLGWLAASPAS